MPNVNFRNRLKQLILTWLIVLGLCKWYGVGFTILIHTYIVLYSLSKNDKILI